LPRRLKIEHAKLLRKKNRFRNYSFGTLGEPNFEIPGDRKVFPQGTTFEPVVGQKPSKVRMTPKVNP